MKINTKIIMLLVMSLLLSSTVAIGLSSWQLIQNRNTSLAQIESLSTDSLQMIQIDSNRQREELTTQKKEYLESQVHTAIGVLQKSYNDAHDIRKLKDLYRTPLQNALNTAFGIIVNTEKRSDLNLAAKKRIAADMISQLRYGPDNKDYFWINDMGSPYPKMIMHPIAPSLNGKRLNNPKYNCAMGKKQNLFAAFVEVCGKNRSGFVDYLWPKPGEDKPQPKLSFVKLFKKWNWVIGTGVYLEVAEQKLKDDAMEMIKSLRYGPENKDYFWINDMGSPYPKMIMHPIASSLDGKELNNPKYNCAMGRKQNLFKAFVEVCKRDGHGFVDYLWPKPGEKEPQPKLSYVKLFKEWNWVIGTGTYINDIEIKVQMTTAELEKKVGVIASDMKKDIETTKLNINKNVNRGLWQVSISSICIIILVLLVSVFWTRKNINTPINKAVQGLSGVATAISANIDQVSVFSQQSAEGAAKQAASIEETSASLDDIFSMTKQNSTNAQIANDEMKESNQVVSKANNYMTELISSMDEMSKASEETSKIIKTIDEIAFQTNLLALNAAVEAARAGEAGSGFAVVADEVRSLAMLASEAARNTSGLIEGTVKKVIEGSNLASTTNKSIDEVSGSTYKVGDLVGGIASSSNEQSQGIELLSSTVREMADITMQNTVTAEKTATASENVSTQMENMKYHVDSLVRLTKGSSS